MAELLLKNTCFHEINVAGIPDNADIPEGFARIVSLINDIATMHTRPDSADNFDPLIPDGARLFLITSYNEDKAVIDAGDGDDAGGDGDDAGGDGDDGDDASIIAARAKLNADKARAALANMPDTLEAIGGKRTRRRKNHGSKRRNASNKSGRRASKQSRRRGKKQSKRHGRK